MGKKLYVGNLTYEVGDGELLKMFEAFGTVQSAQVIMDRDTGRSKGFGFVEMGSDQEARFPGSPASCECEPPQSPAGLVQICFLSIKSAALCHRS